MANYNAALTEQKIADNKNCQARKILPHKKKTIFGTAIINQIN